MEGKFNFGIQELIAERNTPDLLGWTEKKHGYTP